MTFDIKLNRNNMQMFLREAESKLGTQFPRECIAFLRTNVRWKPRAYNRSDYMIEGEGINFTAADEVKMKISYAAEEVKANKHIERVLLPAICQHLRNALSAEVENDLIAHRDYSEWAGHGEDQHKCGDDPFVLMSMLHDQSRRNRFNDNPVLKAIDLKKMVQEQRNIYQSTGQTVAQFKQRCMDVEAESIMCGLTPLTSLEQVLIFSAGLLKGSKASRHFDTLISNAEATPASFPTTLNKAWESLMILETLGPPKTQPSHSSASANANPTRSSNNNNSDRNNNKQGPGLGNSAKKPHQPSVSEREQTINVVTTKGVSFHEYPVHSVMVVMPTFEEATGVSEYDLVRDEKLQSPLHQVQSMDRPITSELKNRSNHCSRLVSPNPVSPQKPKVVSLGAMTANSINNDGRGEIPQTGLPHADEIHTDEDNREYKLLSDLMFTDVLPDNMFDYNGDRVIIRQSENHRMFEDELGDARTKVSRSYWRMPVEGPMSESDDEVTKDLDDYPDSDDLCAIELSWPGATRTPKTIIMTVREDGHRNILATSWGDADTPIRDDNRAIVPDVTLGMATLDDFEVKESIYRHVDDDLQVVGTGQGLFTKKNFSKGSPLLLLQGTVISTSEADALQYPRNQYLIRIDNDRVLDSHEHVVGNTLPRDIGGRANEPTHLYCRITDRNLGEQDANADVVIINEEEVGTIIMMYATTDMQSGDEILWNYRRDRDIESEADCEEDDEYDNLSPPPLGWLRSGTTSDDYEESLHSQSVRMQAQQDERRNDEDQGICTDATTKDNSGRSHVTVLVSENRSNHCSRLVLPNQVSPQKPNVVSLGAMTANSPNNYAGGISNIVSDTLLDNQAGISLFKDISLLKDIRLLKAPFIVKGIESKGKGIAARRAGFYGPFGLVAVCEEASSNIISVAEMRDRGFMVDYDQGNDSFSLSDIKSDTTLTFIRKGRHYVLAQQATLLPATYQSTSDNISGTVEQRAAIYPKSTQKRAISARQLQARMGYIPSKDLASMNIQDTEVTAKDLSVADHIWGPAIPSLQGRSVKRSSPAIIPGNLMTIERAQTLQVDIMFIAGLPFMVGLISPLGYCVTQYIQNRKTPQIQSSIMHILAVAKSRHLWISHIISDNEGGVLSLTDILLNQGIQVSPTAAGEKAHKVERRIRYIKERVRSIMHSLPYNLNALLLIHCVAHSTWCTNLHIVSDSTANLSPHEVFTGRRLSAKRDLRHSFGDYVQATVPHPNNTMGARTEGHITLGSTNSLTGGVRMYCLATGELRVRDQFQILPIPTSVISYLDKLAKADNLPDIHAEYVEPTSDQLSTIPPPASIKDFDPKSVIDALTANWRGAETPLSPQRNKSTRQSSTLRKEGESLSALDNQYNGSTPKTMGTRGDTAECDTIEERGVTVEERGVNPQTRGANSTNNLSVDMGREPNRTSTKTIHLDEYEEYDSDQDDTENREYNESELNIAENMPVDGYWNGAFQQFSVMNITVTRALAELGDEARESISKELRQLWEKKAWTPVDVKKMPSSVRRAVIRSSMFLKQKFDAEGNHDKLKSRLVAGGHMQDKTLYEDLSSPTAALMSVLLVCAIAAYEHRKTATVDIGGAYLNADMMTGITVHMMLDKRMSEMLLMIDDTYKKFLTSKGELCVRLDKALYGCVESALLWHKHLTATLLEMGFIQNPIDPCLYNMIDSDGLQCTAVAHVDDLLITCKNEDTIQLVLDHLKDKYKTTSESRGTRHSYLGMTVDFGVEGECSVGMTGYEGFMLEGYDYQKKHPTPAAEDLFDVDETSGELDEDERKYFHTYVAKLLYLAKRTRPECLVATSFLCTRVTRSTKQDKMKLDRVMGYLRRTPNQTIVFRPGHLGIMPRQYVDASYGVHMDGKSHTGACIIIGDTGAVFNKSSKQSIVTKSSTEAELVAGSDALNQLLHARELVKHQDKLQSYEVGKELYLAPSPFYQDNKSTIELIKTGRAKHEKSRHINIRHFWIHGKVLDKSIVIEYMPTKMMIANVLTKSLQGEQFRTETAMITGNLVATDDEGDMEENERV